MQQPGSILGDKMQLTRRVGNASGNGLLCFVYLFTKFTTPEELFGTVSVSGLKEDDYRRIITGKLPEAELALLDEIFKASSAILNNLLRVMNEGDPLLPRARLQLAPGSGLM
jgi:MoxR-like ATPase